jgi:hypothetical protein
MTADIEKRVETLENELRAMSQHIQMERRLQESRWAACFAEFDTLKREIAALPRVIAEMIASRKP